MKCIVSRPSAEGRRRKYRRDDGTTVETIEVPLSVWRAINRQGRGADRAAAHARQVARDTLKARARMLVLVDDWKPLAAAHELGVPVRTVHRWIQGGLT